MALAGYEEQNDLPSSQAPVSAFHDFINQQPNFRTKPRWEQEQYAASWLKASSPKFRALQSTDPLYNYKIEEFLNGAMQQTTGEKVQHAAEELGPPGLAAAAGLAASTGGAGVIPTALAAGGAGALGEFIPQLRPMTTGEIPPPWSESFKNAGITGTTYPFLDAGTSYAAKGIAAASRRAFVPQADEAGRQIGLEAVRQYGGIPGITQRGGGPVMQQLESIGDAAIPLKGMATRRQQTVDDAVASMTLDTIRKASPIIRGDEEMSRLFFQESKNLREFYNVAASQKYQVVDDLTQQKVGVNMRPVMNLAGAGIGPGKKYPGMNPGVKGAARTITDDPVTAEVMRQFEVPALRDPNTYVPLTEGYKGHEGFFAFANKMGKGQASFSDAQRFSSALKQIARDNPDFPGMDPIQRKAGRLAGTMAKAVDNAMDHAATQYTQQSVQALVAQGVPLATAQAQTRDFAQEYQAAKAFYKENVAERFENETFRGLAASLKDEPAKFSRLATAADSPGKLRALREAAPNLWPDMQARILRSIYERAVDVHPSGVGMELDELISKGLVRKMDGNNLTREFNRLGQDYVKELSQGQVTLPDIQRLGAAIEVAGERPQGQGKTVIIIAQGAALANLAAMPFNMGYGDPWSRVGMLVSPNMLSLALSRPSILNMMERGILGGPKSEAFAKFSAFAFAEHVKEMREQLKDAEHLGQPASQLTQPVGPALSQASMPPPPPVPQVPQLPMLGQQRILGQPPR